MNAQRKGQFLLNAIRGEIARNGKIDLEQEMRSVYYKALELRIWNMSNEEFDRIMSEY